MFERVAFPSLILLYIPIYSLFSIIYRSFMIHSFHKKARSAM